VTKRNFIALITLVALGAWIVQTSSVAQMGVGFALAPIGPVAILLSSPSGMSIVTETCDPVIKQVKDTSTNPPTYTWEFGCPAGLVCGTGENPPVCQSHSNTDPGGNTAQWCTCGEDMVLAACFKTLNQGPDVRDGVHCSTGASCLDINCIPTPGPWVAAQDPNKEKRTWTCECSP